jgi:hypothetical protein
MSVDPGLLPADATAKRAGGAVGEPASALGDIPQLSPALHRDPHGLVHGGGRTSAVGRLWAAADRRCSDTVS